MVCAWGEGAGTLVTPAEGGRRKKGLRPSKILVKSYQILDCALSRLDRKSRPNCHFYSPNNFGYFVVELQRSNMASFGALQRKKPLCGIASLGAKLQTQNATIFH